jgi:uncharacterized membrane protein
MKLKKTAWDWITEALSLALVLGTILYLIVMWKSIPDTIPAHYNAAGEVNRWGGKSELLMLRSSAGFFTFSSR